MGNSGAKSACTPLTAGLHLSKLPFHKAGAPGTVNGALPEDMPMHDIQQVLERSRVVAVVGLSDKTHRPSHGVARYLQEHGYRIIPVNPRLGGPVLGEQPYPDLESVPERVDIVDIFRRPQEVPDVVEAALRIGAPVVWMQLGIVHHEAAERARAAGVHVVMDRCIQIEHQALLQSGASPFLENGRQGA